MPVAYFYFLSDFIFKASLHIKNNWVANITLLWKSKWNVALPMFVCTALSSLQSKSLHEIVLYVNCKYAFTETVVILYQQIDIFNRLKVCSIVKRYIIVIPNFYPISEIAISLNSQFVKVSLSSVQLSKPSIKRKTCFHLFPRFDLCRQFYYKEN